MINLLYDCYRVLGKVYGEGTYLKQALTETDTEPKNRAAVAKICYGVLDNDGLLNYYIARLAKKTPKLSVRIVLKCAMYAIKFLNKKPYAVADGAVELMKKMGKGGASGFVNASLRRFAAEDIPLPAENTERLSVQYSYPMFALKRLIERYGAERTEKIISAECGVTTLCFYETDGEKYLKEHNAEFERTPFYNVFNLRRFTRNKDYDNGVYTFQALPSVAICDAAEACEKLLDCCAAPGGKSVRMSYKCGEVLSWDVHPHRVELIKSYGARMGRKNITAELQDASVFRPELAFSFDAVLCDAPCTGLGVVRDDPDIKLNRTEQNLFELVKKQRDILDGVCGYVKKGGYLYYSTCSVLYEENSGQIEDFLSRHKEFEPCRTGSPLPHETDEFGMTFLPDISGGLGFYTAKLKRTEK